MSAAQGEELVKLRSVNSNYRAFALFINKTSRPLSLEWLDFAGDHVIYDGDLHPGESMSMNTFKGHPWVFYESDCRHPLAVLPDYEKIYFPIPYTDGMPVYHEVHIVNPLRSLQQSCLNFIHRRLLIECQCNTTRKISRKVDQMQREFLLMRHHGDMLKNMAKDQKNGNIPFYVEPGVLED